MTRAACLTGFLALLLVPASWSGPGVLAQNAPQDLPGAAVRVRVTADTTLISVGDRISYTVTVEHAADATVRWPDSLSLAPFEVLGAELLPTTRTDEGAESGLTLVLTAFELGDLQIPPFDLAVVGADSTEMVVTTDAFGVGVVSVGLDEGSDIREIKGPLAIPRNLVLLLPWLLLILLAASAGWWWRQRRAAVGARPYRHVEINRSPHVIAYEALDRLEASDLLVRGKIKEFHVAVSEIMRGYVEGRYRIYALEMTSRELLEELERVGMEGHVLSEFHSFLQRCDLVKFAKLRPPSEQAGAMVGLARRLVDETRPRFETPEPEKESDGTGDAGPPAEEEPATAAPEESGGPEVATGNVPGEGPEKVASQAGGS